MERLLPFVLDVTKSVARHGFNRILTADGHGSNVPILELVALRTNLETESLCAKGSVSIYYSFKVQRKGERNLHLAFSRTDP